MKKILLMILVMCLAFGCVSVAAYNPIDARIGVEVGTWHDFYTNANSRDVESSKGIVVAQHLKTGMDIMGVAVEAVSYADNVGNLTLSAYKWAGSYDATVRTQPVYKKTFVDFADCSWLEMNFEGKTIHDEMLLVADQPTDRVGVFTYEAKSPEHKFFMDGVEESGRAIGIRVMTEKKLITTEQIKDPVLDAYETIDLTKYVDMHNMEVRTHGSNGMSGVNNTAGDYGAYAAYLVDFGDTSPKGASIYVYNQVEDTGKVQIIADDLKTGKIICEFDTNRRDALTWETLNAKITEEITGKHIIYFVTRYSGLYPVTLTFSKDELAPSEEEQRIAAFEATKDFELKDNYADTWTATDMLGRKLAGYNEVGEFNPDKQVGMFYWTWHNYGDNRRSVIQQAINSYPGDESEIKNNGSFKGWNVENVWNESVYGIYSNGDKWVIRKQLELLQAAGVDSLFFDSTNGTNTFNAGVLNVAEVMHQMHLEGTDVPKFALMLPFHDKQFNLIDLEKVYENIYSKGLYSDCWYYWEGKPIIMAYPDNLANPTGNPDADAQHKEIAEFFTFRPGQPAYRTGSRRENDWPWLEVYPQNPYGKSDKYGCEAVAVGIAQNTNSEEPGSTPMNGEGIYGRSYTYKYAHTKLSETSKYYGYNFAEQWERAFELNPEFVFITGWNEWKVVNQSGIFYDAYNDEYSRDIEPTKGELKDVYYYQTVDYIRKFKGVRPTPTASEPKTIDINGGFSQWVDVGPEFAGFKGGTEPRNAKAFNVGTVTNNTGRNDIVLSKVARDNENLYFYVKTAYELTPYTDPAWMRLLINTDRTYKTGWEGYDFVINNVNPTESTAVIEKWAGTDNANHWRWEKAADVSYKVQGNEMMIAVPRNVLGVEGQVDIEFKWIDNMQQEGYILDTYTSGDSAPVGRFAYHYTENAKKVQDENVDISNSIEHLTRRMLVMALDRNKAFAYGKQVKIDDQSDVTSPMIINDKTMVPVRFLAEQLGATVEWDDATKTVRILAEKRITLTLNSNVMKVEKASTTLQSPATEVENRIYVPLRDIVEALGMGCHWIEPGIICIGPDTPVGMLYVNGGLERIMDFYGLEAV